MWVANEDEGLQRVMNAIGGQEVKHVYIMGRAGKLQMKVREGEHAACGKSKYGKWGRGIGQTEHP